MDIKLEEVEWFGLVSTILGVITFITISCWDGISGSMLWQHSEDYGLGQIVGMAGSGLYSMWALAINRKWH